MININYNNENYLIKNFLNEFTIDEFEDISFIMTNEYYKYDKYVKILLRLGLKQEIIDNLDADEILALMKLFNLNSKKTKIVKEIKLNNLIYSCYDKKFKLTVKNMLLIESYMTINPTKFFGEILAILYTNKDCTLSINEKAKLIRENISIEIAIPLINEVNLTIIDNLKLLTND